LTDGTMEDNQSGAKKKVARVLIITIDTNCINAKQEIKELNQLEEFAEKGQVQIVKTDVLDTEFIKYEGKKGEKSKVKAAEIPEDIGIGVLAHSRLDHTKLASEEEAKQFNEIVELLFDKPLYKLTNHSRLVRDAMHLHTHLIHQRDIFVSTDYTHI